MAPRSRIFVSAAFGASLFVLAGAGAVALSDEDAPARPLITDIRVGERGLQTRIALFCETPCAPEPRGDGAFFLPGAADAFELDISDAGARALRLESIVMHGGSALIVEYVGTVENSTAGPCTVAGRAASCLDLFFAEAPPPEEVQSASLSAAPEIRETAQPQRVAEAPTKTAPPPPALRETANDRLTVFASLSAPERLQPPILAKVQPIEETVTVGTPTLRPSEPQATKAGRDFEGRIATLLGKSLTPAYCNNAEATLQTDAWALGAMVDVGLCAAARGDATDAESILSRLLEYAPDNYEALVGKAVIAELAGERGAALRFYQDALDATPPVRESARIVEAMAALS